jgi:hypothetical protein
METEPNFKGQTCQDNIKAMKRLFHENLTEGLDGAWEEGMSEYDYAHNWEVVEGIVEDTLNEGPLDVKLKQDCGIDREEASEILEGYWNKLLTKPTWQNLSRKKGEDAAREFEEKHNI